MRRNFVFVWFGFRSREGTSKGRKGLNFITVKSNLDEHYPKLLVYQFRNSKRRETLSLKHSNISIYNIPSQLATNLITSSSIFLSLSLVE